MNENVINENGLTEDPVAKIASRYFLRLSYRILRSIVSEVLRFIWFDSNLIETYRNTNSGRMKFFPKSKNKLIVR